MTPFDRLSSDIQLHLDRQESTGWFSLNCPVCGEKRKRTGGFKFGDEMIVYNCFRGKCDANCRLENGGFVSRKFKELMLAMGVTIPIEILTAKRKSSLQLAIEGGSTDPLYTEHSYSEFVLPDGVVPLEKAGASLRRDAISYFESRRCPTNDLFAATEGRYAGLFGFGMYQGRRLIGINMITDSSKYFSLFGGNAHVLYTPEHRLGKTVILVEGGIDAKCFPSTAATLSASISPEQASFLHGRRVIMLPDRTGKNRFIEQFHQYGWEISIPDWEEKDLNAAVMRFGKLVAARKIMEGIQRDRLAADVRYGLWAK